MPFASTLLAGPVCEPVGLIDAKAWLRLDTSAEDDLVSALITAARLVVETSTRRFLITQTWRLQYDAWPQHGYLSIPFAPFQSLSALRVFDKAGSAHPISSDMYDLDSAPDSARLVFVQKPPAPGRPIAGIELDLQLGYGDLPTAVPEPLRQAMRLLITRWFENRGDVDTDTSAGRLPSPVAALIAPYRQMRLL